MPREDYAVDQDIVFRSDVEFDPVRIHGAAIYCSDGRFGEACDDFIMNGLGLPRYDRIALPGGPGALAGHPEARLEHDSVADELRFLVEAHKLDRVVLISHHQCAFYSHVLKTPVEEIEARQRADISRAAEYVREITKVDRVETYFARPVDGRIRFERFGA
ncbi:MAG: carbonic anhydrase [Phycisphaerales bacterium]